MKKLLFFLGFFYVLLMLFTRADAFSSFSKVSGLCDESYKGLTVTGDACWPVVWNSTVGLEFETWDHRDLSADLSVPFQLQESISRKFIEMTLPLELQYEDKKERFESKIFVTLGANKMHAEYGAYLKLEEFAKSKRYTVVDEDEVFKVYKLARTGTRYLIPKNQPDRGLYLKCMKLCHLFSNYRYFSYRILIPKSWASNYKGIQYFVEKYLEGIALQPKLQEKES